MSTLRHTLFASLIAAAPLMTAAPALAQSGQEVIETAAKRYNERMAGIDNYSITQKTMGFEFTAYYEKEIVDGRPVFMMRSQTGGASDDADFGTMYDEFHKFAERATLEGKEDIGGHSTYALTIEDFSGTEMEQAGNFEPKKGTFYIDTDDYVVRKMRMEGESETDGEMKPITMEVFLDDYRKVSGMLHPFKMTMRMDGMSAAISDEDLEEARRSMEEMKARIDQMPEEQQKMMENMVKEQMERLEQIVSSGTMEVTMEVLDLVVNQGPPNP